MRTLTVSLIVLGAATLGLGQEIEVTRSTIDAGGAVRSTGGAFELSGTTGQSDAARLTGGNLELSGGFWFGIGPADCNDDGLVSLLDQADFEACLSGPDGAPSTSPCPCFDVVSDGVVDLLDFATLQREFGRP